MRLSAVPSPGHPAFALPDASGIGEWRFAGSDHDRWATNRGADMAKGQDKKKETKKPKADKAKKKA